MSDTKPFVKRILTKPPFIFPWVALFHITMLLFSVWNFRTEPFPSSGWVQPLWMLVYTVSWIFCCDLKRWAGYTYIIITSLNILLHALLASHNSRELYTNAMFPMDILFTFFVMYFIKHFD
ncbi:MAG: hypothetical protein WCG87_10375 [Bacteroidota bacterium]